MGLRLKSPASRLFTQPFIQAEIKENSKALRNWLLCGEFTGTGEFPAQMASNAENVSIWWRHHVPRRKPKIYMHLHHYIAKSPVSKNVPFGRIFLILVPQPNTDDNDDYDEDEDDDDDNDDDDDDDDDTSRAQLFFCDEYFR